MLQYPLCFSSNSAKIEVRWCEKRNEIKNKNNLAINVNSNYWYEINIKYIMLNKNYHKS
jgi:hypothetical protein